MKKLSTKKLSFQLSLIIISSLFGTFLFFVIAGYNNHINSSKEDVFNKLKAITNTLAVQINANDHKYITNKYNAKNSITSSNQDSVYNELHKLLYNVQKANGINSDIYTLFLDEKKELNFAITSGITPYFRHTYSSAPEEIKVNFDVGALIGPYKDKHGTWLSAFSPIKDINGKTIAIIQADQMFDEFIMEARKKLYGNLFMATALFLFVTSIVLYYVKKITKIDEEKSLKIKFAFDEVKEKNKNISDSINYAKRIQRALVPSQQVIKKTFPNSFILYYPKDVVSGDFPWHYQKDEYVYLAAVDCTGHGVPGAMMSIIGALLLNDIANNIGNPTPAELLNMLHKSVVKTLKQDNKESIADGMDIALCRINCSTNEVMYSGAHRPLYYWNNSEIIQFKGDKYPIGGVQYENKNYFKDHTVLPKSGESIYFFSDGLQDQFNYEDRKFGPKRIREIISQTDKFSLIEKAIETSFLDWKGDVLQTDDILLIGIQF